MLQERQRGHASDLDTPHILTAPSCPMNRRPRTGLAEGPSLGGWRFTRFSDAAVKRSCQSPPCLLRLPSIAQRHQFVYLVTMRCCATSGGTSIENRRNSCMLRKNRNNARLGYFSVKK